MTRRAPPARRCRSRAPATGFTLVEVLVALAIVAIALTAGTQATSALARNAARQADVMLAHICAENELVKVRLARQMPSIGDSTVPCEQAGLRYDVAVGVRPTPNPQFRRVDAQVFDATGPVLRLSTIVGRY
ncbi:type II secretion system protein GspI [Paracidovorax avenae]|uniref:type II secretion system minor pseudopilin GspI n=1 Tax=Paracidovorax avenae TaxID=80867 RepID=UPI0006B2F15F|nr:type II secretion system minor pseudopilin GspI [Paracidovorax avenae]AVS60975.1 type II secretion system protein GspI [Paracidovorax avenae]